MKTLRYILPLLLCLLGSDLTSCLFDTPDEPKPLLVRNNSSEPIFVCITNNWPDTVYDADNGICNIIEAHNEKEYYSPVNQNGDWYGKDNKVQIIIMSYDYKTSIVGVEHPLDRIVITKETMKRAGWRVAYPRNSYMLTPLESPRQQ